jgi:hypothetical protein
LLSPTQAATENFYKQNSSSNHLLSSIKSRKYN